MRTQACREKIHKTAELCNLSPETVAEIDRVAGFVKENPTLSHLTTDAVKPLMAISDPEKQQEVISLVEKSLNRRTPTGGVIKRRLTKPEVLKTIEKVLPSEKPEPESCDVSPTLSGVKPAVPPTSPQFPVEKLTVPEVEYEPHKVAPVTSPTNPIAQKKSAREFYAAELFNAWGKSLETFLITIRGDQPNLSQEMTLYNGVIALAESKKKR